MVRAAALVLLFTPAAVHADWTFRRGDCNADATVNIGDAIWTLASLFSGGPAGPCQDACDSNDDGLLNIADAVFTLGYLFSGGPAPAAPGGTCGVDPTPDALDCVGPVPGCPDGTPPPAIDAEPARRPPPAWPGLHAERRAVVLLPGQSLNPGQAAASTSPPRRICTRDPLVLDLERDRHDARPDDDALGNDPAAALGLDELELWSVIGARSEFTLTEVDFTLPGVGIDLVFQRRYRSRHEGTSGVMGHQWDHSLDLRYRTTPHGLRLHTGDHHAVLLELQSDGVHHGAVGYPALAHFQGADLVIDFGNGGRWVLEPDPAAPGGASGGGRVAALVDIHGNTVTFAYDAASRLDQVTDTVGRVLTFTYDADGRLATIDDGTGRVWTYAYYPVGDPDGGLGDLKSVTTPAIVGTPNANDHPLGRTTVYTYTSGHADARLNHNLRTVIDALGHTLVLNTYDENPASPWADHLVRQEVLGSRYDLHHVSETPGAGNQGASHRLIVNDARGAVTEAYYDAHFRLVLRRDFTGFADPALPTTETTNRPGPPLRVTDPSFFETRLEWNADHRLTRVVHPRGDETLYTYEGDLDPMAPLHRRTNLRAVRRLPAPGAPAPFAELIEACVVEPSFGGFRADVYRTEMTNARGSVTVVVRDSFGNALQVTRPAPGAVEDFEYDAKGRLTAHVHPSHAPLGLPPVRRRDEYAYPPGGPAAGLPAARIVDATGFALTTTFAYDARGHLTSVTDPSGAETTVIVNALGEAVAHLSPVISGLGNRYQQWTWWDLSGRPVKRSREARLADESLDAANPWLTTIWERDLLGRVTRVLAEKGVHDVPPGQLDGAGLPASEFVIVEHEVDNVGRLVRTRSGEATRGVQLDAVVACQYDERGLLYRCVRGAGGVHVSTEQHDYDAGGNLVRHHTGLEAGARITHWTHDGFDRVHTVTDPMGNIVTLEHDANGNVTRWRLDGELIDGPGSAGNLRLAETEWTHDGLDRPLTRVDHRFDPATQAPVGGGGSNLNWDFTGGGHLRTVTDDSGDATTFEYDTAGRPRRVTDAAGNQVEVAYDAGSCVIQRTDRDQTPVPGVFHERHASYVYDGLDRLITQVLPMGETRQWAHAWYGTARITDERGNVTRRLGDGLGRITRYEADLTASGQGGTPVVATAVHEFAYDDNHRLVTRTDAGGYPTTHEYDALDRLTRVVHADATEEVAVHDAHDQCSSRTDANGSLHTYLHDALGRLVGVSFVPGPGVDPAASFLGYTLDGRGQIVAATSDDGVVTRAHDSLGELLAETVDGLSVQRLVDDEGNLLRLTYPSGRQVDHARDALGRITMLTEGPALLASYTYIGPDRVRARDASALGGGITTYDHDDSVRLIAATTLLPMMGVPGAALTTSYAWDPARNLAARAEQGPTWMRTTVYEVDSLDRLTASATMGPLPPSPPPAVYTLDLAGNRTHATGIGCSGAYTRDPTLPHPADAQVHQYTQTPCDLRAYSASGELLATTPLNPGLQGTVYTYDALGQLRSHALVGGLTTTYHYDAFGRQIRVLSPAGDVRVAWCEDQELALHDTAGVEVVSVVYGASARDRMSLRTSALTGSPQDLVYHLDLHGSVQALTDGAGAIVERYEYGDHGQHAIFDGLGLPTPSSLAGNPYAYHGARLDPSSGLYQVASGAYLEPTTGRSISTGTPAHPAAAAGSERKKGKLTGSVIINKGGSITVAGGDLSDGRLPPDRPQDTASLRTKSGTILQFKKMQSSHRRGSPQDEFRSPFPLAYPTEKRRSVTAIVTDDDVQFADLERRSVLAIVTDDDVQAATAPGGTSPAPAARSKGRVTGTVIIHQGPAMRRRGSPQDEFRSRCRVASPTEYEDGNPHRNPALESSRLIPSSAHWMNLVPFARGALGGPSLGHGGGGAGGMLGAAASSDKEYLGTRSNLYPFTKN